MPAHDRASFCMLLLYFLGMIPDSYRASASTILREADTGERWWFQGMFCC